MQPAVARTVRWGRSVRVSERSRCLDVQPKLSDAAALSHSAGGSVAWYARVGGSAEQQQQSVHRRLHRTETELQITWDIRAVHAWGVLTEKCRRFTFSSNAMLATCLQHACNWMNRSRWILGSRARAEIEQHAVVAMLCSMVHGH